MVVAKARGTAKASGHCRRRRGGVRAQGERSEARRSSIIDSQGHSAHAQHRRRHQTLRWQTPARGRHAPTIIEDLMKVRRPHRKRCATSSRAGFETIASWLTMISITAAHRPASPARYMEFKAPGFGIFGILSIILLRDSSSAATSSPGLAGWEAGDHLLHRAAARARRTFPPPRHDDPRPNRRAAHARLARLGHGGPLARHTRRCPRRRRTPEAR